MIDGRMSRVLHAPAPAADDFDDDTPRCAACGYDLRGLAQPRCPECGLAFDRRDLLAEVPWLYRAAMGTWDAFAGTVRLVLLHPARLADQCDRSVYVEPAATHSFRRACLAVAAASLATVAVLHVFPDLRANRPAATAVILWLGALPPAALFLFVAAVPMDTSGFQSCSEHVRFRRLHDFTCAPLLLMPLAPLAYGACRLLKWPEELADGVSLGAAALLLVVWFAYRTYFQCRAAGRSGTWVIGHALLTAVFWPFLMAFSVVCGTVLVDILLGFLRHR